MYVWKVGSHWREMEISWKRESAAVRSRRVITIMRMDVFIMTFVSHSILSPFSGSLEWLRLRPTSGGAGPHLVACLKRGKNLRCVFHCERVVLLESSGPPGQV